MQMQIVAFEVEQRDTNYLTQKLSAYSLSITDAKLTS